MPTCCCVWPTLRQPDAAQHAHRARQGPSCAARRIWTAAQRQGGLMRFSHESRSGDHLAARRPPHPPNAKACRPKQGSPAGRGPADSFCHAGGQGENLWMPDFPWIEPGVRHETPAFSKAERRFANSVHPRVASSVPRVAVFFPHVFSATLALASSLLLSLFIGEREEERGGAAPTGRASQSTSQIWRNKVTPRVTSPFCGDPWMPSRRKTVSNQPLGTLATPIHGSTRGNAPVPPRAPRKDGPYGPRFQHR